MLDVAGVGFELMVTRRTLALCGNVGDEATIHTSLSIRENEWILFGFAYPEERQMFSLLQSVNGVGPKMALALLSTLSPEQLSCAILAEDHKMISQAPGVGHKMAQRLSLELRSKMEEWQSLRTPGLAAASSSPSPAFQEVRNILEGLGYTPVEITMALQDAQEKSLELDVEMLVRHSLRLLGAVAR